MQNTLMKEIQNNCLMISYGISPSLQNWLVYYSGILSYCMCKIMQNQTRNNYLWSGLFGISHVFAIYIQKQRGEWQVANSATNNMCIYQRTHSNKYKVHNIMKMDHNNDNIYNLNTRKKNNELQEALGLADTWNCRTNMRGTS